MIKPFVYEEGVHQAEFIFNAKNYPAGVSNSDPHEIATKAHWQNLSFYAATDYQLFKNAFVPT
jgi:hypothetical protein